MAPSTLKAALDRIRDKRVFSHSAFDAKMNIHRGGGGPIFLGAQTAELTAFDASTTLASPAPHPPTADAPHPAAPR